MPHRSRLVALASAAVLMTACTDVTPGVASPAGPTTSAPAPPSSAPAPSSVPVPTDAQSPDASSPADTGEDGGPAQPGSDDDQAGQMHIKGLRLTGQNGLSRLVVDLGGNGVPEWTVGYAEAVGPDGAPVDVAGDAVLRVRLRTGTPPSGQSRSRVSANPGPIVEARTTGFSGGNEEVLIGIHGGQLPFRAYALTDPGRIVIDVHPGG
ncbi:AMIN-like domain-containing (lipo)protein [Blastococcus deserti]|uniref:AMIN-like domain-containing protein n=1 Tax=Blastococcus deserti TaxID=2259033 RepID=A0ABW4X499_9ACTN